MEIVAPKMFAEILIAPQLTDTVTAVAIDRLNFDFYDNMFPNDLRARGVDDAPHHSRIHLLQAIGPIPERHGAGGIGVHRRTRERAAAALPGEAPEHREHDPDAQPEPRHPVHDALAQPYPGEHEHLKAPRGR